MALSMDDLKGIPLSYASCSIGYSDEHTIDKRLDAIASAKFTAIELSMPDIVTFATQHLGHEVGEEDFDDLVKATEEIKKMCDAQKLGVMMLQPFANFEGWPADSPERKNAFDRARGWIRIMQAAGTDMLQVGSSDTPAEKIGTDRSRFVSDLQELADMLAEHRFRLAYENWCWSTHAPLWTDVWDIVKKVDRPNVGLCLDTFQSAGGEWADPTTDSGLIKGFSREELDKKFQASCDELAKSIPKDKIYLLQISDAYKPTKPISKEPDTSGLRSRGQWSHDYRPIPFQGGYLPVVMFAKAVLQTGFRGWFSYEVFDGGADGQGVEYDLKEYAQSAYKANDKLLQACSS